MSAEQGAGGSDLPAPARYKRFELISAKGEPLTFVNVVGSSIEGGFLHLWFNQTDGVIVNLSEFSTVEFWDQVR